MFFNAGKTVFDLWSGENYFKKAPRDRGLAWLGVNANLSRLQKNAFQRNQFADYLTLEL